MEIKKIRPLIYVSGPYTQYKRDNKNISTVEENVAIAQLYANEIRRAGFAVYCPHANSGNIKDSPKDLDWNMFMEESYSALLSCNGIYMLPNWQYSKGANIEKKWAEELELPIFTPDYTEEDRALGDLVDSHNNINFSSKLFTLNQYFKDPNTVWEKSPKQVHEFLKTIRKMFEVHLKKNMDYSPHNILGTGEIGLCTRTWDKVSRLMNLIGFNINTGKLSLSKEPKNESIDDNLQDLAVYSIIWMLYRKNCWGQ